MGSKKTLIVYASKMGAAEASAFEIARVLREKFQLQVDLVDLRKNPKPNPEEYENVIIGSGVRMGKIYAEFMDFLNLNLRGKRIAAYISSGESQEPGKREIAIKKYILDNLVKYPDLQPISIEAFGGKAHFLGINFWSNFDLRKVTDWAEKLGKMLG
jgi:menaquinone-dependent protoporphyrinogen oxidase